MKRALVLMAALAVAACAPQREDFAAVCQEEAATRPIPPRLAAVLSEEAQAGYRQSNAHACQTMRLSDAQRAHRARWLPVVAIVLGAGSDALATHNFYTYRVPEAQRYLRR